MSTKEIVSLSDLLLYETDHCKFSPTKLRSTSCAVALQ